MNTSAGMQPLMTTVFSGVLLSHGLRCPAASICWVLHVTMETLQYCSLLAATLGCERQ